MPEIIPVSALLPTYNRRLALGRMLESLARQAVQPAEMIVVDASAGDETGQLCSAKIEGLATALVYRRAEETGAAAQRNQAFKFANHPVIMFLDDDIIFEDDCLSRLWQALCGDERLGGVSAMITNQRYFPPGRVSRTVFRLLHGSRQETYAGKCIGPALNLLPEDRPELPEVVPVEWLNTTCTLYRREALPQDGLFPPHFTGYSMMEDLCLSLLVGREWKLANARLARIFHDSQPGDYKQGASRLARMELVNRHFLMTRILGRTRPTDYLKLTLLEAFGIASLLTRGRGWVDLPAVLYGKLAALGSLFTGKSSSQA
ncbi:MAG TPA: glycosyltransferase family 2 protein [Pyrinomonadaceae bacterium]|jgi:glycosyltransferase involved in cell wall biosynthesis